MGKLRKIEGSKGKLNILLIDKESTILTTFHPRLQAGKDIIGKELKENSCLQLLKKNTVWRPGNSSAW